MADQKDNYIADHAYAWRDGSLSAPSRPADEDDENVLASIAYRHASRRCLRGADFPTEAASVVSEVEPSVVSEVEPPEAEALDHCQARPGGVFYARQAIRKSQYKPTRGEVARDKLARGKIARVLIVYLLAVTGLTGLAVVMYFLTL